MITVPVILPATVVADPQVKDIRRIGRFGVIDLVLTLVLNVIGPFHALLFGLLTNSSQGVTLARGEAPKSAGLVSAMKADVGVFDIVARLTDAASTLVPPSAHLNVLVLHHRGACGPAGFVQVRAQAGRNQFLEGHSRSHSHRPHHV